jgi:D-alanine-D-alanine ligase-like ATP-grasp enzyme
LHLEGKTLNNYIFERFYNYSREYRLHVTEDGCFYTCRKMLKSETPEEERWFRNDSNSVWVLENNPSFDKPINWNEVIEHSVKALKAVGLDIGAVDLRIQSSKHSNGDTRDYCDFIVLEINSAPSFGDITAEKYAVELSRLINKKLKI